MADQESKKAGGLKGAWQGLRQTIYGMAAHDMSR